MVSLAYFYPELEQSGPVQQGTQAPQTDEVENEVSLSQYHYRNNRC